MQSFISCRPAFLSSPRSVTSIWTHTRAATLRRRRCTQKVDSHGIHVHTAGAAIYIYTFSAVWLWSSVVSVLISVTTDMSPTGDLLVTSIFAGEVSSRACSGACKCCAGMALSQWQHTLWGNRKIYIYIQGIEVWAMEVWCRGSGSKHKQRCMTKDKLPWATISSQHSLRSAPIFRLLLKIAVNGTRQCDFHNFCGGLCSNCCLHETGVVKWGSER